MECLQRVSLSADSASTHAASLPDRTGHRIFADLHPGYQAESQAAEDREGDRTRRVHQEDRLHLAPYNSLRAGLHLWKRTRIGERRRTRWHFPDGREHV